MQTRPSEPIKILYRRENIKTTTTRDIRLLAFDLDGTVLNHKKQVTQGVQDALLAAIEAGIEVLPATGRQLAGVPAEIAALAGIRYAITANGARIVEMESQKTIYEDCFSAQKALELLALVHLPSTAIAVYIEGKAYCEEFPGEEFSRYFSSGILQYARASRTKVPSLAALMQEKQEQVEKFSILFSDLSLRKTMNEMLCARTDCSITSSLMNNLEINTPTANKGAALLVLAQRLGIQQAQTMAIGDSDNDIEMLRAAGYGVAMGNAPKHVRDAANTATLSCEEDGVAHAIHAILQSGNAAQK